MDDILQRMLLVEQDAERLAEQATHEAETVVAAGRREANLLEERAQTEIAAAAAKLVDDAVAATEKEKREALAAADEALSATLAEFRVGIEKQAAVVVDAVAFPLKHASDTGIVADLRA